MLEEYLYVVPRKTNDPILKYDRKTPFLGCFSHFWLIWLKTGFFPKNLFWPFSSLYNARTFSEKLDKTNDSIFFKSQKISNLVHFDPFFPKNGETGFFPKNRAPSLLFVYWTLTSCKKSEKTNEPIPRKVCYWRTDWLTDGRTDKGWFHRSLAIAGDQNGNLRGD